MDVAFVSRALLAAQAYGRVEEVSAVTSIRFRRIFLARIYSLHLKSVAVRFAYSSSFAIHPRFSAEITSSHCRTNSDHAAPEAFVFSARHSARRSVSCRAVAANVVAWKS